MQKIVFFFLILISLNTQAMPNFNAAKTQLVEIYAFDPGARTLYCGCSFYFLNKSGVVDLESCGYKVRKNEQRAQRIEWEHVMPAHNFGRQLACWKEGGRKNCKKDKNFNQMEGDLHNLQPSIGEVNSDRSNFRYSLFTKQFNQYGQCRSATDFTNRRFQPRIEARGIIARSYLYMSQHYNIRLSKQDENLMRSWNHLHPVDRRECQRNQYIQKVQGNSNPFISQQCNKHVLFR